MRIIITANRHCAVPRIIWERADGGRRDAFLFGAAMNEERMCSDAAGSVDGNEKKQNKL